jgi:hypothetical protein
LQNILIGALVLATFVVGWAFAEFAASKYAVKPPITVQIASHQHEQDAAEGDRHQRRTDQDHYGATGNILYSGQPQPADPKPQSREGDENQDLQAQQDMARSARISWVVGLISAGITLLGVIYVKQTLVATVGMLDEARETTKISQKQFRRVSASMGLHHQGGHCGDIYPRWQHRLPPAYYS